MKKAIFLLALLVSFGAVAQEQKPMVSVIGEGVVNIVPDGVVISARVEHSGDSVQEVKRQNDKVVNEIIQYLRGQDIPSENIQTERINLRKEHNYNTKEDFYSANQAVSIKLDDLKKYEEVMEGLMESGLNRIDGIEFKTSQRAELESEARKEAVLDAKEKATEYAEALGQEIGKAFQISEMGGGNPQPVYRAMAMKSYDEAVSETIAIGEMEVKVKVNVSFILK